MCSRLIVTKTVEWCLYLILLRDARVGVRESLGPYIVMKDLPFPGIHHICIDCVAFKEATAATRQL